MKNHLLFFILFVFISTKLIAQNFGGNPSDIEWKSIESKNVQVIFPDSLYSYAKRIASIVDYLQINTLETIGFQTRKLPIILQSQQVISNGFVTLSPYRSEFYLQSPQNFHQLGSTEWLDLLSIHEYRHALQYTNSNRGFTKAMHILGGQNGWGTAMRLSVPNWYFEGDAVLSETILTKNGRGRIPSFSKEQRALLLENQFFTYEKARNGSFKDLVPNHYALGYAITNHLRNNFGLATSRKILADAGRYKSAFYPFSSAMKSHTGYTTRKMYKRVYSELQKKWTTEINSIKIDSSTQVSAHQKTVTSYTFPKYLNDGSIVCIKKSFAEIPSIVHLNKGIEKKILELDLSPQEYLTCNNNRLAWTAYQIDPRRSHANFSNIVTYDFNTHKKRILTKKGKFFSPAIASDGKKIIAVLSDKFGKNNLVLLDSNTGKILEKISNPSNDFFSYPKWSTDDKSIYYIGKRNSEIAFFSYDLKRKKHTQISKFSTHTIGNYTVHHQSIFYSSSYSGIDNIYKLKTDGSKQIAQITSVKIGTYMPEISESGTELLYSEFSKNGYSIQKQLLKNKEYSYTYLEPINQTLHNVKANSMETSFLDSLELKEYPITDYKGFFKGLKLHSWGLTTQNEMTNSTKIGVVFQNLLSDFYTNIAGVYNSNENSFRVESDFKYSKYFIELNGGFSIESRNLLNTSIANVFSSSINENRYKLGGSLPLSRIKNNFYQSLKLTTDFVLHDISSQTSAAHNFNFTTIETGIRLSNIQQTAKQNIYPKYGQEIVATYKKSLNYFSGNQTTVNSIVFAPGFFPNHSINSQVHWRKEKLTNGYLFSDAFPYARGFTTAANEESFVLSTNYHMPIFYPDFGFFGMAYFKRIRGNFFFDWTQQRLPFSQTDFSGNSKIVFNSVQRNSFGIEFYVDSQFLNILPASIGFRNTWLSDLIYQNEKKQNFEIFLQINF